MRTPKPHVAKDGAVTWKVQFRLGGHITSETFNTRREAGQFARDLKDLGPVTARRRLDERYERADALTLNTLAEKFWTWKLPRVRSDRTVADYQRDYRNWVAPTLGGRAVVDITQGDVQQWVDAMVDGSIGKASAAKSIIDRHALLHQILAYAASPARKLIPANPCADTDLPKKRRTQPKGLNPAEWQALAAALRQVDPDGYDLTDFLISTGWRWSEATDLTTFDVEDYGERGMWVTMSHVARRNAAGQRESVEDGKGSGSQRRIRLDQDIAATVRRRVAGQDPGGLVFTTATGARWHYSNFVQRIWEPAVAVANLGRRPTVHWLRHTAVMWGSMAGANIAELSARIGHRHISTTVDVYGGSITDVQAGVLDRLAELRNPNTTPGALPQGKATP